MIQLIRACINCYLQELDKDQDAGVCNIVTHHLNHPLGDNHIAPSCNKGSVACLFPSINVKVSPQEIRTFALLSIYIWNSRGHVKGLLADFQS
jgi:hypothetical protein